MSTGQMYSGKGETTTQSPQNEQSVANPTVQSVPSHISLANAQVEAAINYLLYDYQGSQIPEKALHELASQIKNIVSLTFAGEAEAAPDSALPIYVQVPEEIVKYLSDDSKTDRLLYAAEAMRDYASIRPQETENAPLFEEVHDAFCWIVKASKSVLVGRQLGREVNPPMVASGPTMPFIPQFIFNCLGDEEQTKSLRELIAKMGTAAELDDFNNDGGENTPAYRELIRAFNQWVDLAQKSMVFGSPEPVSAKVESAKKPVAEGKRTYYRAARKAENPIVIIESDCIFFDLITDPEYLGNIIENVTAWFAAWTTDIDSFPGDFRTSHFHFANLMEFLGRMPGAIAQVQTEEESLKTLRVQLAGQKELGEHLKSSNEMTRSLLATAQGILAQRNEMAEEVKRLRNLYEPGTPTPEPIIYPDHQ